MLCQSYRLQGFTLDSLLTVSSSEKREREEQARGWCED